VPPFVAIGPDVELEIYRVVDISAPRQNAEHCKGEHYLTGQPGGCGGDGIGQDKSSSLHPIKKHLPLRGIVLHICFKRGITGVIGGAPFPIRLNGRIGRRGVGRDQVATAA
jgi:hypothetical protein